MGEKMMAEIREEQEGENSKIPVPKQTVPFNWGKLLKTVLI